MDDTEMMLRGIIEMALAECEEVKKVAQARGWNDAIKVIDKDIANWQKELNHLNHICKEFENGAAQFENN